VTETFDPVAALDRHARASASTFAHDRTHTVGASEIGQCARKVYFLKNEGSAEFGRDRDATYEDRWGATVPGSIYEEAWWAPAMRAEAERLGGVLLYAGADQRTLVAGFLSATPDGLTVLPSVEFPLECKTRDPRARRGEPKPEHVYQVQVQLGLIRETTNHRPGHGLLIYTDRSFWDDVEVFRIDFDPGVYERAKARARQIMTAEHPFDLKAEGIIAGGKECEYCPFQGACGRVRAAAVPDASSPALIGVQAEEIGALAARAREAAEAAEAAEQDKREAEDQIKRILRELNTRKVASGGYSVSWSSVAGRESWDHKGLREAAEAAGVDLSRFKRTGEPSDRLVIQTKSPPAASGARNDVRAVLQQTN
jgi:hypothetical protein